MNFATGVMCGDFARHSKVYYAFAQSPQTHMKQKQENWMHGDQGFVASIIGLDAPRLQDLLPEGYIVGKRLTSGGKQIPGEAKVFAWSGRPRLHELPEDHPLSEIWRSA
jgi:hypothetical protein